MFTFKVTPDEGEPFEVRSNTRDILQWEGAVKGVAAYQLNEPRMEWLYRIAYIAARRTGQFSGLLKEFEASVDIETVGDEEPDPTQPGATADQ